MFDRRDKGFVRLDFEVCTNNRDTQNAHMIEVWEPSHLANRTNLGKYDIPISKQKHIFSNIIIARLQWVFQPYRNQPIQVLNATYNLHSKVEEPDFLEILLSKIIEKITEIISRPRFVMNSVYIP